MRSIIVTKLHSKYTTSFLEDRDIKWSVESYVIMSHEIMVSWIENGIHPEYRYT